MAENKFKRNLSGMYFRVQEEGGAFGNVCFEDLSEQEQDNILDKAKPEFIKGVAKGMARTINKISDQFDIRAD